MRTHEEFGRIDVAIANAGVLGRGGTFRTLTPDQVGGVMSVNVAGVVNTVAATLESVISSRGQIVLVSSVFAYINGAGAIPYAMSKAAVEQLGRGLGVELASHGASAMTAYFSLIETDMIRQGVDADPHVLGPALGDAQVHPQANPASDCGRRDCRRPGTQANLHYGSRPLAARRRASRRGRTDFRCETRARCRRAASACATREPRDTNGAPRSAQPTTFANLLILRHQRVMLDAPTRVGQLVGRTMAITRAMAVAVAVTGAAVGLASPAWADEPLDGDYIFTNGATTNTWTITTRCNAEVTCGGMVSSNTGMDAGINRLAGGPWIVERRDVSNGWTCVDGSTGPADLTYSFDPATLVGTLTYYSKPGVCNDPNEGHDQKPISLQRQ